MDYKKEMQKGFIEYLDNLHEKLMNIVRSQKEVKIRDILDIVKNIDNEIDIITKDIKISESDAGNTNSL